MVFPNNRGNDIKLKTLHHLSSGEYSLLLQSLQGGFKDYPYSFG